MRRKQLFAILTEYLLDHNTLAFTIKPITLFISAVALLLLTAPVFLLVQAAMPQGQQRLLYDWGSNTHIGKAQQVYGLAAFINPYQHSPLGASNPAA